MRNGGEVRPVDPHATASDRLDARDDDAIENFAREQGVTAEQVRWMLGRFGSMRSRLILEARKLLDKD